MFDPGEDSGLITQPLSLDLDGRVVWVTGASRGLGRSLAYAFAGAGASVFLTARSEDELRKVAGDIEWRGGDARLLAGSVTEQADIDAAIAAIEGHWGRLDTLVNNAGISHFERAEQFTAEAMRKVLDVNLVGPYACSRAALPLLTDGGGSVVNISSIHGTRTHERVVGYAASKGGLEMMTRNLALEWAPLGVRVNSLAPGYLQTEMTGPLLEHPHWGKTLLAHVPMGRFGTTGEIAGCALFLASPLSAYVTGTTLYADGGWTAF
jgi:NAD(P)-dependent dehydrogenase (short-subunit alcohol dehydrogenase family)